MAQNVVEILLQARDEVSLTLDRAAAKMRELEPASRGAARAVVGLSGSSEVLAAQVAGAGRSLGAVRSAVIASAPVLERMTTSVLSLSGASGQLGAAAPILASGIRSITGALAGMDSAAVDAKEGIDEVDQAINIAGNSATGFQAVTQQVSAALRGLKVAALGTGLVLTALSGIALAAGLSYAGMAKELERVSQRTGLSIRQLQSLREAAKNAGLAETDIEDAINHLNRAIATNNPLLEKIGVTSKNAFDALFQLSDAYSASTSTANKAAASQALLGRGSSDLVGVIQNLRKAYADADAELAKSGRHMSGEAQESSRKLRESVKKLRDEWASLWVKMQEILVPLARLVVVTFNAILGAVVVPAVGFARGIREFFVKPLEELAEARKRAFPSAQLTEIPGQGRTTVQAGPIPVIDGTEVSAKRTRGPLDDPNLFEGNKALERRRQLIAELVKLFKMTTEEATRAADQIIRFEDATEKMALAEKLRQAVEFAKPLAQLFKEAADEADRLAKTPDLKLRQRAPEKLKADKPVPIPEAELSPMFNVLHRWEDAVEKALESTTVFHNVLQGTFDALHQGFESVFLNLTNKAQTFKSAMTTIFGSLRDTILRTLASIVASQVFKIFLKLAGAVLGIPITAGSGTAFVGPPEPVNLAGDSMARPAGWSSPLSRAARTGDTFIIQAIDARSAIMDLTQPGGSFRRARGRVAVHGAY